ncbi:hypothetical protein KFE25_008776 [Diacronema lutheri]|uniref:Glycosyltransferase 2-like domain-containing protein n=1 Tax=Diacronema lutheri TaxID=2081491 RepID=A0A8J5XYP4_DIALT|nr:hypothetical protein KFE25_008776 [Diacronema lutheri]
MLLMLVLACWPLARAALFGARPQPNVTGEDFGLTLVVTTFFGSEAEPRFHLAVKSLAEAARWRIPTIVVDASGDTIRERLRKTGAHVVQQAHQGKKGAALREGIELAIALRRGAAGPQHVIGFFEPEKLGMVFWMRKAAAYLRSERLDIVIPSRADAQFAATYPREQYHQEVFANLLIDSLAGPRGFPHGLDWTFGPVLFDARLAPAWLDFAGPLWDAQVVPYVRAVLWRGAKIGAFHVPYTHPAQMKEEEEGKAKWARKRFEQLALWANVLPPELTATSDPGPTVTRAGAMRGRGGG